MSAVPNTTIEDALQAAVVAASGIAADRVRWAEQNLGRPDTRGPWISMRLLSLVESGPPWVDIVRQGGNILHTARCALVGSVSLQCFEGAASGTSSAIAILERVRAKLVLPSIADVLAAANVAITGRGPTTSTAGQISAAAIEPRAMLELRFTGASEVTEVGGYIETADLNRDFPIVAGDTEIDVDGSAATLTKSP